MSDTPEITDYEWQTLRALCNAIIPDLHADGLAYKQEFERVLGSVPLALQYRLRLMLHVLSFRGPAFTFTASLRLVTEMSKDEIAQIVLSLHTSRIPPLRMFVHGLVAMGMMVMYRQNSGFRKVVGDAETHPHLEEYQKLFNKKDTLWILPKFSIPKPLSVGQPSVISTDVVLVGSGCSAMVAAYRLTQKGFNVIIVEKGYHLNGLTSPLHDFARDIEGFENKGYINSSDSSMMVLAGATVGGGGAVNWSCALRPHEMVRQEWVEKGAPFYGTSDFDHAIEEVERIMHVSTDFGSEANHDNQHSFTNNLILESSKKLNYRAKATGQNTGKHKSNSGFVEFGTRQGADEGGIAEWFRYSLDHGARILQRSEVVKIRHHNGHASGVEVVVEGSKSLLINCKRVVCCAGSLHTPVLLQKSNFKNRHIGKGLKLHPVTVVYGEFPHEVNKRLDPIMTAVSTEVDNLDGKGHGPKIEAIHHRPALMLHFMPYRSPSDWQSKANKTRNHCALLVITRDKGSGKVSYHNSRPGIPAIEYTPSNYDVKALHEGSLNGANMLYVGGAERIFLSSSHIPDFVSTKPASERSIWDPDYQQWYQAAKKTEFVMYDTKYGSAHQMASCRMSDKGPKYGAVDAKGHLYECPNVHVIDASVFPSASGVNPMITCMATAYVLAQNLIDDLQKLQTKL